MASNPDNPWLDPAVAAYCDMHSSTPDEILRELVTETAAATGRRAVMQISAGQGVLLQQLARGARFAVEVGTFTGYSSICLARGMGAGGRLLCCDVSEEWTAIARRYWARAGLSDRIELRVGPALETLRSLPAGQLVDLAFIDADKHNYQAYFDELFPRLRIGGLILVDNTLWYRKVLEPAVDGDVDTAALQAFNDTLAVDPRVDVVLLPISDGLTVVQKR
ncbi:MAG: O-methyltransferase [Acidimicrobiales bacterium]